MACTSPRSVGFKSDGKTLAWSPKDYDRQYIPFQLPCGKCIDCRLAYAREWAIRCVHEAQMHEDNIFATLTYSDEHLKSPRLQYDDFQKFMKRLRKTQNDPIGMFVTGEYGEITKRPHWHAIIFNYRPSDQEIFRTTENDDRVFTSERLSALWGKGHVEFGSVTLESAGYCARYAAKKLVHGRDQDHDFHPISKKSSKHAIGKSWIERYWPQVVNLGFIYAKSDKLPVPRYYQKWIEKHQPDAWRAYVVGSKDINRTRAGALALLEKERWEKNVHERRDLGKRFPLTRNEVKAQIKKSTFEQLQKHLKL